jgi:hypothetical protein
MTAYLGACPRVEARPDMSVPVDYPSFRWLCAPVGLGTRRQLAALGLRPGGMQPVARIVWRRGDRFADLYPIHQAKPKRTPTPAQLSALDRAMEARRTCRACGRDAGYCLPRRWTGCLDCTPHPDRADPARTEPAPLAA